MKIAVCLPSFNESKNIENITKIIDSGLTDFVHKYPGINVEIINVDSNSTDGTVDIFLNTHTKNTKQSLLIHNATGKGSNILAFCKYVVENNIDYCLTIDTDITSATPDWVSNLLEPMINSGFDFVIPIYERSRFEGSTTNHFCFPFIYALTGIVIRQPIAGDFGFSNMIAATLSESKLGNIESIKRYGIDIFMTNTAINRGGKIRQVDLGKKVHAPSFDKMEFMFPQVASSAILSINIGITQKSTLDFQGIKNNILTGSQFTHREAAEVMKQNALSVLSHTSSSTWVDLSLIAKFIDLLSKEILDEKQISDAWIDVFVKWINYYLKPNLDSGEAENAGRELLPFFVLRATSFWFWADTVSGEDVEVALRKQAEMLKDKLNKL